MSKEKLYVYLAGYMSGDKLSECLVWRKKIRNHYTNWKGAGVPYPIVFLDPFNSYEIKTINEDGTKSVVPYKAIVMGDYKAVSKADVLVVNLDTFGGKRPSIGTLCEMAWAWQMKKPIITIVPENNILKEHPFIKEMTTIFVKDVEELLRDKHLNIFYKRIAGAIY